jgi:hypothetical protein
MKEVGVCREPYKPGPGACAVETPMSLAGTMPRKRPPGSNYALSGQEMKDGRGNNVFGQRSDLPHGYCY